MATRWSQWLAHGLAERWFPAPLRGYALSDTLEEVMSRVRRVFHEVFAG